MKRRTVLVLVGVAAALVVALVLYLRTRSANPADVESGEANVVVGVRVAKAERKPIAAESSTLGTISAREQATVSPKIGGQIVQMRLLKNANVRAGR